MIFSDISYENSFREGDRIKWEYVHSLNSRSKVKRIKKGVFVRYIMKKDYVGRSRSDFCIVRFDGNKTDSRVLSSYVMHEIMTRKIYKRK